MKKLWDFDDFDDIYDDNNYEGEKQQQQQQQQRRDDDDNEKYNTIQHLTVAKKRVNQVMIDKNITYGPILGYVVNHVRILRNKP